VFGQHSAEILGEYGYSADDIDALHDAGVLFDAGRSEPATTTTADA
jgi:hypothetical protein